MEKESIRNGFVTLENMANFALYQYRLKYSGKPMMTKRQWIRKNIKVD